MLVIRAKRGEFGVLLARARLSVIPGHDGDQFDLVLGEAGQLLAVADHVVRVLVVTGMTDEQPDVVDDRGRFEQLACIVAESVQRAGPVEQLPGQQRGVFGMFRIGIELASEPQQVGSPKVA